MIYFAILSSSFWVNGLEFNFPIRPKYGFGDAKMDNMSVAISYNRLWKLLIDRKLKKKDLQRMTHLSSSVIAKMGRDESVHLDTVVKICIALQCDISDIVEIKWKEV